MDKECKKYIQENTKTDFEVLKKWTDKIEIADNSFYEETKKILADKIRHMIIKDMEGLLRILYRMDVNENKLRKALKENEEKDAALLITDLYLQRIIEKYHSKKEYADGSSTDWIFDI